MNRREMTEGLRNSFIDRRRKLIEELRNPVDGFAQCSQCACYTIDEEERARVAKLSAERTIEARQYDELTTSTLRQGNYLMSAESDKLSQSDWDAQFAVYRRDLERLRGIADRLRTPVKDRGEALTGDALTRSTRELFAA